MLAWDRRGKVDNAAGGESWVQWEEGDDRCAHAEGYELEVETRAKEKDGEKKMERERWRKSQVLRTEATVVRGGLRDQD
jgi:hypothetical protein